MYPVGAGVNEKDLYLSTTLINVVEKGCGVLITIGPHAVYKFWLVQEGWTAQDTSFSYFFSNLKSTRLHSHNIHHIIKLNIVALLLTT